MIDFDPVMQYPTKREKVKYIVPERIREACGARGLSYREAALVCKIDENKFSLMANGHMKIPEELIFNLMSGFDIPKEFFYFVRWKRC